MSTLTRRLLIAATVCSVVLGGLLVFDMLVSLGDFDDDSQQSANRMVFLRAVRIVEMHALWGGVAFVVLAGVSTCLDLLDAANTVLSCISVGVNRGALSLVDCTEKFDRVTFELADVVGELRGLSAAVEMLDARAAPDDDHDVDVFDLDLDDEDDVPVDERDDYDPEDDDEEELDRMMKWVGG